MARNQIDPMERLARSMELLLRLKVEQIKGERSNRQMILLLANIGATAAEISAMTGISRTIVAPEMSKARSRSGKGRAVKKR